MRTIIYGYYLTPSEIGYYSIAITVASYGVFSQLGLVSGLSRELPVILGKSKQKDAANIIGSVTSIIIVTQCILLVFYFLVLYSFEFNNASKKESFYLAGLIVIPSQLISLVMLQLRSYQKQLSFSILQFLNSFFITLIGIFLIKIYGFRGAAYSLFIVNIISFLIITFFFLPSVNYSYFNLKKIIYLVRIGFPLMIAGVFVNLYMTMDKMFLFKSASSHEIGIYQVGILTLTFGTIVNGIATQYFNPKFLFDYGAGKSINYLFNQTVKKSFILLFILTIFFPFVYYTITYVIKAYIPKFEESIHLLGIFYIGAIFTGANLFAVVRDAKNKQVLAIYHHLILCVISFTLCLYIFKTNKQNVWYAYSSVFIQILNFFTSLLIGYFISKKTINISLNNS